MWPSLHEKFSWVVGDRMVVGTLITTGVALASFGKLCPKTCHEDSKTAWHVWPTSSSNLTHCCWQQWVFFFGDRCQYQLVMFTVCQNPFCFFKISVQCWSLKWWKVLPQLTCMRARPMLIHDQLWPLSHPLYLLRLPPWWRPHPQEPPPMCMLTVTVWSTSPNPSLPRQEYPHSPSFQTC